MGPFILFKGPGPVNLGYTDWLGWIRKREKPVSYLVPGLAWVFLPGAISRFHFLSNLNLTQGIFNSGFPFNLTQVGGLFPNGPLF